MRRNIVSALDEDFPSRRFKPDGIWALLEFLDEVSGKSFRQKRPNAGRANNLVRLQQQNSPREFGIAHAKKIRIKRPNKRITGQKKRTHSSPITDRRSKRHGESVTYKAEVSSYGQGLLL